ncbi:hypothetical protein Tco_0240727, partial [Tanacetum coccineum]
PMGDQQGDDCCEDLENVRDFIHEKSLFLLTYLPSCYCNFMETLLYGQNTLKLKDVLTILHSKELHRMTEAQGDGGEGLYVRGRSNQTDMEQGMKIGYPVIELIGGSDHMPYKRDYFVDFEEYDSGNVLLSDGRECRVRRTGGFYSADAFRKDQGYKGFTGGVYIIVYGEWGRQTHLRVVGIQQHYGLVEETNVTLLALVHCTGSVDVLQGVEFEVEPHENHTFEVEPHGNVTKGLLDKAKGNVLDTEIVKNQSGNTMRVSQSRVYNGNSVQTLLDRHFHMSLKSSSNQGL